MPEISVAWKSSCQIPLWRPWHPLEADMSIIDTLITDRTQSDVTRWRTLHDKGWVGMTADEKAEWSAGVRGAYNATDLNRVGEAIEYIADLFSGFGFPMDIMPKTDWTINDIPTSQDLEDYLSNVAAMRSMMSNIPVYPSDWQAPPKTLKPCNISPMSRQMTSSGY